VPDEHSLDLGLFRLPLPESQAEPGPEQEWLGNHPQFGPRAACKRAFWQRVRHDHVVPLAELPSSLRELVPEERHEAMTDPGVIGEPARYERPLDLDESLEECSPQFCLRNLERYEKDAWVDDLWWTVSPLRETPGDVEALLEAVRKADAGEQELGFVATLSKDVLRSLRDEHLELMERTEWRAFTWRRGPRGRPDDYTPSDTADDGDG